MAGATKAFREIILALLGQLRDPGYFVRRELPDGARAVETAPQLKSAALAA
jgi:hypothetical protein